MKNPIEIELKRTLLDVKRKEAIVSNELSLVLAIASQIELLKWVLDEEK